MSLPFTQQQFLEVFARYNDDLMPLQIGLFLLGLTAYGALIVRRRDSDRVISVILAALWTWSGIVYHRMYFSEVNPAATMFALVFVAGAVAFAWAGLVRRRMVFYGHDRARCAAGHALVAYALVGYPLLSIMLGRAYPKIPTFGLPCPTTIFTIGMLAFVSPPVPRTVFAVPIAWAIVGTQGAFFLGMYEDLGLTVAGLVGVWLAIEARPRIWPA